MKQLVMLLAMVVELCAVTPGFGQMTARRASPALSRSQAQLSGQILDPSGAVVGNARVSIRSHDSGQVYTATSSESGNFSLSLPAGSYTVVVQMSGFAPQQRSVELVAGQSIEIRVVMEAGKAAEAVEIEAPPAPPPPPPAPAPPEAVPAPPPLRPVSPPSPPMEEERPVRSASHLQLTWNAWTEAASLNPTFMPVEALKQNSEYKIVIDLAALSYATRAGVFAAATGKDLADWLLNSTAPDVQVQLIAIADEKFFDPLSEHDRVKTLSVNLAQLRKVMTQGVQPPSDPLAELRAKPDAEFSFGRVSVNIRTKSQEGAAMVGFVIWSGTGTPIEEFSVPVCIAHDNATREQLCAAQSAVSGPLSGIDPLRAGAQQDVYGSSPSGALHFIQLDSDTTVGIFRDNTATPPRFMTWYLGHSADELDEQLRAILANFDANLDEESLLGAGAGLYNLLFPLDRAGEARRTFEQFVEVQTKRSQWTGEMPPSLFVRLVGDRSHPPFLIPLGLLSYPAEGGRKFLGSQFRIQAPLQVQDYHPNTSCIGNWVVLAPTDPTAPEELRKAGNLFGDWYQRFGASSQFTPLGDIAGLRGWLGLQVKDPNPTLLLLLAHHDSNAVFFTSQPRLGAHEIERTFATPSLAVLNACGDAAPGASQIVQQLNENGVTAVIATATKVNPYLAGDFFGILGRLIEERQGSTGYPIGLILFEAIQRLSATVSKDPTNYSGLPYGAKALGYELLGNSNLRVCSPTRQ